MIMYSFDNAWENIYTLRSSNMTLENPRAKCVSTFIWRNRQRESFQQTRFYRKQNPHVDG